MCVLVGIVYYASPPLDLTCPESRDHLCIKQYAQYLAQYVKYMANNKYWYLLDK